MTDDEADVAMPSRAILRYDAGLNLGHVLTIVTIIGSVGVASGFISARTESNQKQMDQLRSDVTTKIDTIKSEMTSQIVALETGMTKQVVALRSDNATQMAQFQVNTEKQFTLTRNSIDNIPSMAERVSQLEKRAERVERLQDQDHAASIENTTNMNNLLRQLGAAQRIK